MSKFCEECKFFQSHLNADMGECRRRSPQVVYHPGQQQMEHRGWPTVNADDWCGEYERDESSAPVR